MEFLKGLVGFFNRLFFDGFDVVRDNRRYSRRRVSQIESLESREMLSVSIGSFSGYASTAGETEIRFTLNTDGTASKIDFTVKSSEASLDPSAIRLYNRTTQSSVNLADIFNSTTQSGGSALLAKADYSIFVKADKGAGNFKLDIFFDDTPIPTLNALNIIVQAAYLQQQSNATWENMREQFNVALFSIAPEYGPTAFNGGRVIDLFPEADVNKDGKIDSNDSAAASAAGNAAGSQKAPPTVSNNSVKNPDTTPPTIAAALNIPAQNGITTSPIINGKITDTSGIKSAIYKINNGSAQNIILAADGSFTILSDSLAEGKYSITIIATDKYDNQVTYTLPEFTYHKFIVAPPPETIYDNGQGTANINYQHLTVTLIGNKTPQNNQIILAENRGTITINSNGTLTFTAGSYYDYLPKEQSAKFEITVTTRDIYNKTYNSKIIFTINGKNDEPNHDKPQDINREVNENAKGQITHNEILSQWSDIDTGTTLEVSAASIASIDFSNDSLEEFFNIAKLQPFFTNSNGNLTYDATDPFFAKLALGESITINLQYTVTDGIASKTGNGYITITIKGVATAPTNAPTNPMEIDNSTEEDYDPAGEIVITKDEILNEWDLPEAASNFEIAAVGDVSFKSSSFDNNANPFGDAALGTAEIDENGNIIFTPSADVAAKLGAGQWIEIELEYSVKNKNGGESKSAKIIIRITGKNDAPSFNDTETQSFATNAGEDVEIDWASYFDDVDIYDSLTLAKIKGYEFEDGELTLEGIGTFYLDEDGNLTFTPDEKFDSLQHGDPEVIGDLAFTVTDSRGAEATGEFDITINGTNKAPIASKQDKEIDSGESVTFELDGVTDQNDGDDHDITRVVIVIPNGDNIILDENKKSETLANGVVITFDDENNTVTVDTSERTDLPDDGLPEEVELIVTISDDSDAANNSCEANWTVTINNKAPETADDLSYTYVIDQNDDDDETSYTIDLTDQITDPNTPSRNENENEGAIDWYETSNLAIVGDNISDDLKAAILAALTLNDDGTVIFTPTEELLSLLNSLAEGNSLNLTLSYCVTDKTLRDAEGNLLTKTGLFTLTIYAKKAAVIDVDNSEFDLVEDSSELSNDGDFEISQRITITEPEENLDVIHEETTYDVEVGDVSIDSDDDEVTELFANVNFANLFTIDQDESGEYSITFNSNAAVFAGLNAGEELTITVEILVTDQYGVTAVKEVTFTIIGKGDAAEFSVDDQDELVIWGNESNPSGTTFTASDTTNGNQSITYSIDDSDHDEDHTYSFGGLFDENGDAVEGLPEGAILINDETGAVTLKSAFYEFVNSLGTETTFKIKVIATGKNDGIPSYTFVDLTVKFAAPPTIDTIAERTIEAGASVDDLQISVTGDEDAPHEAEGNYTFSEPTLNKGDSINLPDDIDDKFTASIDSDGKFSFVPDAGAFDYLGAGESVTLVFNFSVYDTKYGHEVSSTITIIITGVNDAPTVNDNVTFIGGTFTTEEDSADGVQIDLATLVDDVDQNDQLKVVSINGVEIEEEWTDVEGLGQFKYVRPDSIGAEDDWDGFGGELWYRPFVSEESLEENELEKISAKSPLPIDFTIAVQDNSSSENNTANGTLKIKVTGVNSKPVVNTSATIDDVDEYDISELYYAKDFVTDKNTDDVLTFNTINGVQIEPPSDNEQIITLNDGTKIIVAADRQSFKIDAASRNNNLAQGEFNLLSIKITVTDNSDTGNAISALQTLQFKIIGVDDKPQMDDQKFGINTDDLADENVIGFVPLTDVDTDTSEYAYEIVDDGTDNADMPEFTLEKGENGVTILVDPDTIPEIAEGESITYTFTVRATFNGVSVDALITITFSHNAKPKVTFGNDGDDEVDDEGVMNIDEGDSQDNATLDVNVTPADTEDDEEIETSYSYENVHFVSGKITDAENADESIYALPEGVEFGFNGDQFYFNANGAFDFLGVGESAELTFEFTVYDEINNVGTTKRITVKVTGKNSTPTATPQQAERDILVTDTNGYRFYISDLFSDIDRNDEFGDIWINGTKLAWNGSNSILAINVNGIKYGTVKLCKDAGTDEIYLLFVPDDDAPIKNNEIYHLIFYFNISDNNGEKSDTGTIQIGLRGVNKPPVFKDAPNATTNEKTPVILEASQFATDSNGDTLKIAGLKVGDDEVALGDTIELTSGAKLTLTADGKLIYDPTGRRDNLAEGSSEYEKFKIKVADEFGGETGWNEVSLEVTGINDAPVFDTSKETERSIDFGDELEIRLDDYFSDPDSDILGYEITSADDANSLFVFRIIDKDGVKYLLIKFKDGIEYSDSMKFNPETLTLTITDAKDSSIMQDFTVKISPTVQFEFEATATEPVAEDETYTVTVTAHDLLNTLLGDGNSLGFTEIQFSINFDPTLCDISQIESIGTTSIENGSIVVKFSYEDLSNLDDLLNVVLLSFTVTAKGEGDAKFDIGSYISIKRNDGDTVIDESQVASSPVSVEQTKAS